MIRILMIAALSLLASPVAAAALTATPATLPSVINTAQPGDTITLAAGEYGAITIPRRDYSPALEIDASAATMTSLVIRLSSGINVRGGVVRGAGGGAAVTIDKAARVRITHMLIGGAMTGIAVPSSTDVDLIGNRCDGVRSDCINLAGVQRARVIGNQCVRSTPIAALYSAAGALVRDGDHPDCIQGWSIKGQPPTADILIAGNTAEGFTQGVWMGNPGQGGYDRVTVRDNVFRLAAWHGVSVLEGRGTVIRDNVILPTPGATMRNYPYKLVWPWVYATGTATACGNVVAAQASRYGTGPC